jgi:hypothetical protein
MKRILLAAAVAALAAPAFAGTNVGVSVQVNQPGLYGRVDIGNVPAAPVLVYEQPVVIVQSPVAVQQRPIYLHVPPGHEKHWDKHCRQYNACGQPVYFVRDDWYQEHYVREREHDHDDHDRDRGRGRDKDHDKGRGKGHDKHDN